MAARRALILALLLVGGLALGAGGGWAVHQFMPGATAQPAAATPKPPQFVAAGDLVVPVMANDRRIAGYARLTIALQVDAETAGATAAAMPLFLHEVNMRLWDAPLTSPADRFLPSPAAFAPIGQASADAAFGKGRVRRVIISAVMPL